MVEIVVKCYDCNKKSVIDTSNLVNSPYTNCGKCGSLNAHKITDTIGVEAATYLEYKNHKITHGTPRLELF